MFVRIMLALNGILISYKIAMKRSFEEFAYERIKRKCDCIVDYVP